MKYLIGIDSGGTKSELVAYDLKSYPIYKNIGGYGNPSVDINRTVNNISDLIGQCLNDLREHECIFIAGGIAGVGMGNSREVIEKYIYNTFSIENAILNDAAMTAKAYLGNGDGILAIAGTGSSCYVQKDKIGEVVGGWGHILGDQGSGYHTVIEAFKRIAFQLDNNIDFDNLSKNMMKKINASNASDIKKYIYGNQKKAIASLFPIITELSNNGDSASYELLKKAGKSLGDMTVTAYRKYKFDNSISIGLKGGVFRSSEVVLSSYEEEVGKYITDCTFLREDISATRAVCSIYELRR